MSGIRKIAHIVNPFKADELSDLHTAQPITYETMRIAREFAKTKGVDVELFATCYEEDKEMVPDDFKATRYLTRSMLDKGRFNKKRKLPFFRDILERLYESSDADYFIQTNVDIGLMPNFYVTVNEIINNAGYDVFCINKRVIPNPYTEIDEIPMMYAEIGKEHNGMDCFVYPRKIWPQFDLGDICMGVPWSEAPFVVNAECFAQRFHVIKHSHLTFHIQDPRVWGGVEYNDYREYNTIEFCTILDRFMTRYSDLRESPVICYFLRKLKLEIKGHYPEVCHKMNSRSWNQLTKFAKEYTDE